MKSLAFAVTLLASFGVSAQTSYYYEDGSTYTVQPNEKVYVTHEASFTQRKATKTSGMSISEPKHLTTKGGLRRATLRRLGAWLSGVVCKQYVPCTCTPMA